jgi:hypothetical protein
MFMQQMKPLKNPTYKLILIILLFAALIISVIIYYNRRIKVINDKLKDTSVEAKGKRRKVKGIEECYSPVTALMTNDTMTNDQSI